MACRITKTVCKTEAETKAWGFDYAGYNAETGAWGFLARVWAAGGVYADDVCVRPSLPTGLQYRSGGGNAGSTEPRWPRTVGGTVTDGTITWTAEAISNDSLLATISSSAWAESDIAITLDDETLVNTNGQQVAAVMVAGGAVGETYEVSNSVTLSDGSIEESVLKVTVS